MEAGEICLASEIRSKFEKGRAGKGIEINYDSHDNKYLRLFSTPDSQYGDDLEAEPMRYVGEKDFDNPAGDQVPNRGNGALIESQSSGTPIFLFEKVSENPVEYLYHGRVRVVDFEHNYRPQKGKKEYDFYLERVDSFAEDIGSEDGGESEDDLAPHQLQEINPETREVPNSEQTIEYTSSKQEQAIATNEHETTVKELSARLEDGRWECKKTQETDILAKSDSEALVVEVKSFNQENDGDQIRKALGQVFENSYRDVQRRGWSGKDLIRCLGFSQPPADQYSGYLEFLQKQGIEILWREDGEVSGHPETTERLL